MSAPVPRFRDRRHAEAVDEIKATALRLYAGTGSSGLALRAVAREMGLSAQALYHYFDNRDALVTALINDGLHAAASAIARGRDSGGTNRRERLRGAALAYRRWAVTEPHVYRLIYSDIIPDYQAPTDKPAVGLLPGLELAKACFESWTPAQFVALDSALGGPGHLPTGEGFGAIPDSVSALLARWWAQLHGLMSLEILGRLQWAQLDPSIVYADTVNALADEIITLTAPGTTAHPN
ncbi:TetR family transcriptional regulator [Lentzea pudingi]|uniref:TetR family transcriptional regulator n=1 Tax=Lentzea pudingi TaxID=1789439 RepID=A0ABQ2IX63_9PSEU|nr:TetR/AcrR family transcriptional regulator [Lentzea pudingi]GGN30234.1 TetR family transcriptional regulator [Lentzea pudingi]